jgi:arylsulfatase A-like enzyme
VRVLLIVIDAATPRVVCPAIKTGQLPTMQRLVERGRLSETVTIFPSITPAATTSIITGGYPSATGIVGASWFDTERNEVAYYGDDFWVIVREGFRPFLEDFLVRLNGDRLKVPTLFERVESSGRIAACFNYLVFKGVNEHTVRIPLPLALLPGVRRKETIKGPTVFCLGDFVATRSLRGKPLVDKGGLLHRFGMDDASTGELLVEMAEDGAFPDFTVAYFADNDYRSHEVGPYPALPVVERVDRALGRRFDAAGGMDRLLDDMFVLITSDHGHCEILSDADRASIHLNQELADFKQAVLGKPWANDDEIMICPNMRSAQVYVHKDDASVLPRVVDRALHDRRVEHVLWCKGKSAAGDRCYTAASARGHLDFWRGESGPQHANDAFGTAWSWRGDLQVLDARVEDGRLVWSEYPNAFERLAGVLDAPNSGTLWLTARPGSEFEVPGSKTHLGGGSHGGLHALESMCPLIVAGPRTVNLPREIRSVDIAPLCLELLGMPTDVKVGDPR